MASLTHPNIPKYIDYFEDDGNSTKSFYIVQVRSALNECQGCDLCVTPSLLLTPLTPTTSQEEVKGVSLSEMVSAGMRASDEEVWNGCLD